MTHVNELADDYRSYVLQLANDSNVSPDDDFDSFCKKLNLQGYEALCMWREWCDADRDATISGDTNASKASQAFLGELLDIQTAFDKIIDDAQIGAHDDWLTFKKKVEGMPLSASDRMLCFMYLHGNVDFMYLRIR